MLMVFDVCFFGPQITYKIFAKKDDLTPEGHVVDKVLDKTGMKGTPGDSIRLNRPAISTSACV